MSRVGVPQLEWYDHIMDQPLPGFPRLTVNPAKLGGKPCVRGLRLSVQDILRALASYPSHAELFIDYPDLEEADLQTVLAFAAAMADWEEIAWRPPAA